MHYTINSTVNGYPLAAGTEDVEDGVDDVPHVGFAGSSAGVNGGMWGSMKAHCASVTSLG